MGALYREEVKCYNKHIFKGGIALLGLGFAVLLLCFISDIVLFGEYYEMVIIASTLIAVTGIINFKRKMTRVYRYEIIDKEIMIEDVTKGKRIVKVYFNAKNIITLDELGVKYNGMKPIAREYNFICNLKSRNAKRCIFERDGKVYSFRFEPSQVLINKIEALRLRAK